MSARRSNKPKGFLVGGTLGYNYQTGSFVWGLEGDIAWSDVKGSVACGLGLTCETANRWLGTARGRLGYAFDRLLPYITGGGAFGNVRASINPGPIVSATNTRIGWTVGAGLEYAFLGNWTAKIEYLYVDLGSFDTGFTAPVVEQRQLQGAHRPRRPELQVLRADLHPLVIERRNAATEKCKAPGHRPGAFVLRRVRGRALRRAP